MIRPPAPTRRPVRIAGLSAGVLWRPVRPIVIAMVDGHLFRDDSEVYPLAGGRYYIPASGSVMRFRRSSDGIVDALVTVSPWASGERVALRVPGTPVVHRLTRPGSENASASKRQAAIGNRQSVPSIANRQCQSQIRNRHCNRHSPIATRQWLYRFIILSLVALNSLPAFHSGSVAAFATL